MAAWRRIQVDLYLSVLLKTQLQMVQRPQLETRNTEERRESDRRESGDQLECIGTGKEFLKRTLFIQASNQQLIGGMMKLISFYMAKGTIIWTKHQATEWDKILPTTHSIED